jgi:acyl-CoA reductase-like NAD-dependent aldehyde dehydrogenase
MLHIPILRHGKPYYSVDTYDIVHHATGQPVAKVSQANAGLISRDVRRMQYDALESFRMRDLLEVCKEAGRHFMSGNLPLGEGRQSFDDYIRMLSSTTGMPQNLCRTYATRLERVFNEMGTIVAGLTRGFDLSILDKGFGSDEGRTLSFYRECRVFGAVLPSNAPGVHGLWIPAVALKTPIALKPGREEPWTPLRVIQSYIAAGLPPEAFGFYPTDHGGASTLLGSVDKAMLFGDASTTRPYRNNPNVELHGPGYSKVILGPDAADEFEKHLDVIATSIAGNAGRSCLNASGVWTVKNADRIADAVAGRLAEIKPLPADHADAKLAIFANPTMAERMNAMIEGLMPGAEDLCQKHRGTPRLHKEGRCTWLLPTVVRCDAGHPLANREFLFPYASVVESPPEQLFDAIGPTLVGTVISNDRSFIRRAMTTGNIDRLNLGPVPTIRLTWDQPHEGNLFELLYRQRAFQHEPVA